MRFEVTDDSGFLAIIDPDAYQGFVREDWSLEEIFGHFQRELQEKRLLIWCTGVEHFWKVDVSVGRVDVAGFREATGAIVSSQGRLLLTNYESLTMAASYEDVVLPQSHERDQLLSVTPGQYDCRIIQLSDPESETPFHESVNFVYEIAAANEPRPTWERIPWFEFH